MGHTKYIGIICDDSKTAERFGKVLCASLGKTYDSQYSLLQDYTKACAGESVENKHTYHAKFVHPLNMIVSMITGIPYEILNDPVKKKEYVININTLEFKTGIRATITPSELYERREAGMPTNGWLTACDFANYFGHYICKRYISDTIWVQCEEMSVRLFPPVSDYRIYTDIRTVPEYDFIRQHSGIVIRVNTNRDSKSCVFDKRLYNIDVDYELSINNLDDFYAARVITDINTIITNINIATKE